MMYALAGEMPSEQRAKFLAAKEIIKIKCNNPSLYDIIADNPRVKSSYSKIYFEYNDFFDNILYSQPY